MDLNQACLAEPLSQTLPWNAIISQPRLHLTLTRMGSFKFQFSLSFVMSCYVSMSISIA